MWRWCIRCILSPNFYLLQRAGGPRPHCWLLPWILPRLYPRYTPIHPDTPMDRPRMHPGYTKDTPPETPWIHTGYAPQIQLWHIKPLWGIFRLINIKAYGIWYIGMWGVSMGLWDTPQVNPRYTPGYTLDTPRITPYTPQIHPGPGFNRVAEVRGLGASRVYMGCVWGASGVYPGVHMGSIWGVSEVYPVCMECIQCIRAPTNNNFIFRHCF